MGLLRYTSCVRSSLFGGYARGAPHNKQLQRTVMDKVPMHKRQHAAAELRR
jgi:hypothetical protein